MSDQVIWHDVECGGYKADLPLWEELADALPDEAAILELGCGAGRVVQHLATRTGRLVIGVERDRRLVEAVWERCRGIGGDAEHEDARSFQFFGTKFALALAPMQLIQLLADSQERLACLSCVHESMTAGGLAALAIVEELPVPEATATPLPDVRQIEGWIYSSLPLEPVVGGGRILLRRLRQKVDPDGQMTEELSEVELRLLSASTLEHEAAEVGLQPAGRRTIPATDAHVGSTVVLLEAR